jgi:hypothetical protein
MSLSRGRARRRVANGFAKTAPTSPLTSSCLLPARTQETYQRLGPDEFERAIAKEVEL